MIMDTHRKQKLLIIETRWMLDITWTDNNHIQIKIIVQIKPMSGTSSNVQKRMENMHINSRLKQSAYALTATYLNLVLTDFSDGSLATCQYKEPLKKNNFQKFNLRISKQSETRLPKKNTRTVGNFKQANKNGAKLV